MASRIMDDLLPYDPADWEFEDQDADAPVIVCAECGETVHADNPQDLYCLMCESVIAWERRLDDAAREAAFDAEAISRFFGDEVPF